MKEQTIWSDKTGLWIRMASGGWRRAGSYGTDPSDYRPEPPEDDELFGRRPGESAMEYTGRYLGERRDV